MISTKNGKRCRAGLNLLVGQDLHSSKGSLELRLDPALAKVLSSVPLAHSNSLIPNQETDLNGLLPQVLGPIQNDHSLGFELLG